MPPAPKAITRNFASDNNAGVHPEILEAIARANRGHVVAYGDDPYTRSAVAKFEEHFGPGIDVFFTFNGTGANVLGLQAMNRPYHAVLCSDYAHIYSDECGAPEKHTGCKLIPLPNQEGKITLDPSAMPTTASATSITCRPGSFPSRNPPRWEPFTSRKKYEPWPASPTIERPARNHKMFLHMDGARIANAAASLGQTLRQATRDLGIDVLSFGGTKNGMMGGEAVVFFNQTPTSPGLSRDFLYLRKQGMQLASKMRFIAAQFEALLTDDLWRRSAEHANRMARLLEKEISRIPGVKVVWPVEANGVFVANPAACRSKKSRPATFSTCGSKKNASSAGCAPSTPPKKM